MSKQDSDSDHDEIMKNLILFKMPVTDKEMEEMAPFIFPLIFIVILIGFIILGICEIYTQKNKENITSVITEEVRSNNE